ncbi:cyclin-like protein [Fomitopsis serialis]|uniref:cyclin-like protein n=1 Tax=Fomitopsis serialis TaxID=139415 RepID=UPI0020071E2D|nr:cyclin-like protein [Neoantrodia serialis]KAH9916794.1 cyclin-like protein [Neoantrodia serialis]
MATDFWVSSHCTRWNVDRATLRQARAEDIQYVDHPEHLDFLAIFFASLITKLGKKLSLRQRVVATATVFFRRFYLKNAYCDTDPFIVIAACCYVAAKAEESPVHIKNVVSEARSLFSRYGIKTFPSDNSKLAEMEFYLVDDLECDLTVFHPYRTLMTLCWKEGGSGISDTEVGELGAGIDDGPRYWGTGEGRLEMHEGALQKAWFIINDTYRSELCLLYPPHLIAITAIYMACAFHQETRSDIEKQTQALPHSSSGSQSSQGSMRRSSRMTSSSLKRQPPQDIVGFLAGLNVNMALVATIAQEVVSLYALCERYNEEGTTDSTRASLKRSASGTVVGGTPAMSSSPIGTPMTGDGRDHGHGDQRPEVVTPGFLVQVFWRMRETRMADLSGAHAAPGRPVPVNKMLERAQAAG